MDASLIRNDLIFHYKVVEGIASASYAAFVARKNGMPDQVCARAHARQLRRAVERFLENVLAEDILRGKFGNGEIVEVEAGDDRLEFHLPKGLAAPGAEDEAGAKPAKRKKKGEGEG